MVEKVFFWNLCSCYIFIIDFMQAANEKVRLSSAKV